MLVLGEYQTLEILRPTLHGLFLADSDADEVLLPKKYVPASYNIGDKLEVFVYLDFDERIVATTLKPLITRNRFARLKVKDSNRIGAFLDWGLEKDLFVPFSQQLFKLVPGKSYMFYMYMDDVTGRLVASQKLKQFLDNRELDIEEGDEVDLIIADSSDLGMNVVVNQKYLGLIYHDEIFQPLESGQELRGFIKKIRPDNKLDISLQRGGYKFIEPNSEKILEILKRENGFIPLNDKSEPERVYELLGMSKKVFKKAAGALYKQKQIRIAEDGIHLV